jgi:hypothetical protein
MRRRPTRDEILRLQRNASPFYVERELLKAIKKSPQFRAAVQRIIENAERRLLALSPDFTPTIRERFAVPIDGVEESAARENRTAEPGMYRKEARRIEAPRRPRRKKGASPVLKIATATPYRPKGFENASAVIHYEDIVLN